MEPISEASPSTSGGPNFYPGAHGFTVGAQYNIAQQIVASPAPNLGLLTILNPIPDASYTRNRRLSPPDSSCLPGTREQVIQDVLTWVDSSILLKGNHIMWLYGYVGCGKSAIAQTVAEKLAERRRLAASFFFFRGSGDRSRSARLATTIASQIAAAIPATADSIEAAVKREVGILGPTASLRVQLKRLVFEPLQASKWHLLGSNFIYGPYLIVLDGLDECEDKEDISQFIEQAVDFFDANPYIPLRILIASRVEEHPRTRLENPQVTLVNLVDLTTPGDIAIALRASFALAAKHSRVIKAHGVWPTPEDIDQLVAHIGQSFIFMSTIVKFVLDSVDDGLTPIERLPLALNIDPGLDGLYKQTLSRSQHLPHFNDIIWTLATLRRPMSILGLGHLLRLKTFEIIRVLVNLHSIFHVPGDDTTPVTLCHKSLDDFFRSKDRSGPFHAPTCHHKRMAYLCLATLANSEGEPVASKYARSYWKTHLGIFAEEIRSDKTARQSETKDLIIYLRSVFPVSVLEPIAIYLLLDCKLILGEGEVCSRTMMKSIRHLPFSSMPTAERLALFRFLSSGLPLEYVQPAIEALDILRGGDRCDGESAWPSAELSLPAISSFHRKICSLAVPVVLKFDPVFQDQGSKALKVYFGHNKESARSDSLDPKVFCLSFMSMAEHLALSIEKDPGFDWEALSRGPVEIPTIVSPLRGVLDPIALRLMAFLVGDDSGGMKTRFLSGVRRAVAAASVLEERESQAGSQGLSSLQSNWMWWYSGTYMRWNFGSTEMVRSMLDVLARLHVRTTIPNGFGRSISSKPVAQRPSTLLKYSKRLGYVGVGVGGLYAWDRYYNASAITRNLRTLQTCAMITLDYKLNFTPEKSEQIPELHERVAERVYNLLTSNGGLYIKIGQAIGANAAVLPKPMQIKFASLFDDAPQIPYSVVREVFISELGKPPSGPDGVFEIFEEEAVASASIAQVHKARTWDGEWVAVKVQKPDVGKQMEWDLGAYRAVMWMFENWAFDLPVYFVVDFVTDHLRQELDFVREANNALQTAQFVASEPSLRDEVHIPRVYPEYSTKKVMVAEWIEGVRLSDRSGIFKLMGQHDPRSAPPSTSISPPIVDPLSATALVASPAPEIINPTKYQFPEKPLKGGVKSIMQTMVELFSAQMFSWGWVHCDPHPGNIIVRPSPKNPSQPQLVLIDHGLYVRVPEEFKRQWVELWRSMLEGDYKGVESVTKEWGMGLPDLVASFTLMKPTILKKGRKPKPKAEAPPVERKPLTQYEMSVLMKKRLKEFLQDTDRMPKVLIFLTRNMRMVQGNNQSFGSPVNRIKITGYWASKSQFGNTNLTLRERAREIWRHAVFRFVMLSLDVMFWRNKFWEWVWDARQWVAGKVGYSGKAPRRSMGGFEDELESQMRGIAKDSFGVDVGPGVFSG